MTDSLQNHFLVATPSLVDANFNEAVIYIYRHDSEGALGFIINKALPIHLNDVLDYIDVDVEEQSYTHNFPVLLGGPVEQEQGFILHTNPEFWPGDEVDPATGITVSASKEVLIDMAESDRPDNALVCLGYSGWGPGQLEEEIVENTWIFTPVSLDILFKLPLKNRRNAALALLGIDINQLTDGTGHA